MFTISRVSIISLTGWLMLEQSPWPCCIIWNY